MPWWFEALGECPAPIPALPPAAFVLTGVNMQEQLQLEKLGCREGSALLSLQGFCLLGSLQKVQAVLGVLRELCCQSVFRS